MLKDKPRWWVPLEFRVGSLAKSGFPLLICVTVESMTSSIVITLEKMGSSILIKSLVSVFLHTNSV